MTCSRHDQLHIRYLLWYHLLLFIWLILIWSVYDSQVAHCIKHNLYTESVTFHHCYEYYMSLLLFTCCVNLRLLNKLETWIKNKISPVYQNAKPNRFTIMQDLQRFKHHSCINIYAYSCLKPLSNPLKAVFKQLKPCLNHGIHVLFEHGFYLKILKTGCRLFMWRQTIMQGCPEISIFVLIVVDVNVNTFLTEWHQKERKTKWHLWMFTVLSKWLYHDFSCVSDGSFHGII